MDAQEARNFIEEKETFETTINLTADQVEALNALAERSDLSFEDMAMLLLHIQLEHMDKNLGGHLQEIARRN